MVNYVSRLGNVPQEAIKAPVVTVATTNETLANIGQTIDGVVVAANQRVLVTGQTDTTENGIYVALTNQSWVRATDMNRNADVITGQIIINSSNGDIWQLTAPSPWNIGVNSLTFSLVLSVTNVVWGTILGTLANQTDLQAVLDTLATAAGTTSGTFADALVAASNVTQHEAALAITESQITDLDKYTQAQVDSGLSGKSDTGHAHATSDITSGTLADARVAESNVTQHEAALTLTVSQISDMTAPKITYVTATDASWAPQSSTTQIRFIAVGAGGGGGGFDGQGASTGGASGGGAGGGVSIKTTSTLDATYAITIGAAGAAGASAAGDGGAGGTTTVIGSTGPGTNMNLSAGGGAGGSGQTGATNQKTGGVLGGVSSGGDLNLKGDDTNLHRAISQEAIPNVSGAAPGFGGAVIPTNDSPGVTATNPGSGGGGVYSEAATTNRAGGAGAAGIVIVMEWQS